MTFGFCATATLDRPSRDNAFASSMTEETSAEGLRKNRVPMAANTTITKIVEVTGETASLLALRSKNEAIFIVTREDDNVKIVIPRAKSRPREPGWWRATRTFRTSKGAKIKANDMCNRIRGGSSSVSPLALRNMKYTVIVNTAMKT